MVRASPERTACYVNNATMPSFTVRLSESLFEAAEILRKRAGRHYRSKSEYVQNLIRYDAQTQRDHLLTAEWAALSGYERDALDAALLRQVQSGEGIRGSWLEARIEEIVTRLLAEQRNPSVQAVAGELARVTLDELRQSQTPNRERGPSNR